MTEAEFHNKVIWMTFILSILVVMIHSYNLDLFITAGDGAFAEAVAAIQSLVSKAVPTIAVPGFFMVSAYLFYRNASKTKILPKMLRRVKSVLVPYIAWNTLYYVCFSLAGRFPVLWDFIGRKEVAFTIEGWADAILNFTYNPVLWYLKQLIILIALAPLIYAVMSRLRLGALVLVSLLAIIAKGTIIPILNLDALLYYSVGAYLAMHGRKLVERKDGADRRIAIALMGLLICIGLYKGSIRYSSVLMTVLYGLTFPMVIWLALPGELPEAKSYMKFSLFLYSFHFVPVRGLNKIGSLILPHNAWSALLLYLALPVVVVAITWVVAEFLKKKIPPLWSLLSGGR
ncbi:MAG: acyltransferase [Clostridium sp.]